AESGNRPVMPPEIVTALIIVTAEGTQELGHRIIGGFPAVVDVFRGVLIFVSVADLGPEFKSAEVGANVVNGGVRTGAGEVQMSAAARGDSDVLEAPITGHLKRRIGPVAIVAEVWNVGVGLRGGIVTAIQRGGQPGKVGLGVAGGVELVG